MIVVIEVIHVNRVNRKIVWRIELRPLDFVSMRGEAIGIVSATLCKRGVVASATSLFEERVIVPAVEHDAREAVTLCGRRFVWQRVPQRRNDETQKTSRRRVEADEDDDAA